MAVVSAKCQKQTYAAQQKNAYFDHLVGARVVLRLTTISKVVRRPLDSVVGTSKNLGVPKTNRGLESVITSGHPRNPH